jgi:hypothetical protein
VLYRVVVHAPAGESDEQVLARLREVLEDSGLEVGEVHTHESDGNRVLHFESALEAPSAYHASIVSGPDLFERVLEEAGLPTPKHAIVVAAQRAAQDAPAP